MKAHTSKNQMTTKFDDFMTCKQLKMLNLTNKD
jgi:hypothetical protein